MFQSQKYRTEVKDVSVPEMSHEETAEIEDVAASEIAHEEITEVEDVSVPKIALGEIAEAGDASVPETSKVVDPSWTDWIHTLNRLNKLSEALLPPELNPFKAKEDEKSRECSGGSDDHHRPASDVKVAHCSCQINLAVVKEWKASIRYKRTKLLGLLKKYPCLLAISDEGNTVLHAAAREGNLKLLVYTCSLFLDDLGNAIKEYVHGDNKVDRRAFFEKENDDQLTAQDCLWFTIGKTTMYVNFEWFGKYGESRFYPNATLAAMQDEVFNPFYDDRPTLNKINYYRDGTYEDGGVDAKCRMKEVIIKEYNDRKEQLDEAGLIHGEFIAEYEELLFLLSLSDCARRRADYAVKEEYLRAVIRGCVEEGPDVVECLFRHRNFKGQTAFHCANVSYCAMLMEEIPPGEEYKDCFNARDVRGWTALHCATVKGEEDKVECLLKDSRVDVNAESMVKIIVMPGLLKFRRVRNDVALPSNGVALHLAIMHNRVKVVRMLLQRKDIDVNALSINRIDIEGTGSEIIGSGSEIIGCDIHLKDSNLKHLTPLQRAVFLGRHEIIKALLHHPKVDDPGVQKGKFLWPIGVQLHQNANEEKSNSSEKPPSMLSAIHLAGIMGDPKTLRCFLNISKFDLSVTVRGCTTLHFVVDATPFIPHRFEELKMRKVYFYNESQYGEYLRARKGIQKCSSDKDREASIAILIQAGLDVWQKNDDRKFPEPGVHTSPDVRHFWQQKLLIETQDAKNNLNDAGNAVSIVSALVATASYVGPLQPPLGLDSNFVQDQSLPIRIYMVTNTMAFYMAVASILFAVVPSLPMPQEGLYEEWQRSQRTIALAIHLLLLAVLNTLISFGAASNVIVSSEYSWQHKGLVFYPTLLGGSLCIIAICLFYLRLLRLAYVKNLTIKRIYHSVYRATRI